jgi:cyclophilin family peptidyl-prolyl cis-trans isomerase
MATKVIRPLFLTVLAVSLIVLPGTGCRSKLPEKGAKSTDTGAIPGGDGDVAASAADPRYQQSFAEATRKEAPEGWRPPQQTLNGLSVGKLYLQVKEAWQRTPLVSPSGKLLQCTATLETDRGVIEITLRPDWAPNHVRNFMVLARLGYYDGLVFERLVREQSEVKPEEKLEMIQGGCPLGTGETFSGSIGYWLLPELDAKLVHEEGTVGAPHDPEPDTAGTRFYITLSKPPYNDAN